MTGVKLSLNPSFEKKKFDINLLKNNFLEVFLNWKYLVFAGLTAIAFGVMFAFLTDAPLIKGNMGIEYYWINFGVQAIITLLFAIFLPLSVYKIVKFSDFSVKGNSASALGTFLGILVAGCPACSVSVASYIGLAGLVSLLPWYGLELKIIAIPMLGVAIFLVLKDLNVCRLHKKFNTGK